MPHEMYCPKPVNLTHFLLLQMHLHGSECIPILSPLLPYVAFINAAPAVAKKDHIL